jgi:hypothetical protein
MKYGRREDEAIVRRFLYGLLVAALAFAVVASGCAKKEEEEKPPAEEAKVIEYIDLRFSDDSPQDGVFGASLFTIEAYVNGELVKKIDAVKDRPIQGLGDVVGNHRDANGGKSFVYRIEIPEKEFEVAGEKKVGRDYVKDVRIVCRVANDYRIEMATDKQPTFVLVAHKKGNVVDEMGKAIKEKINKPEDVEIRIKTR